ncbi:MAG: type II methionyl aminopeptidase [Candidatus Nanoarchaeia archaeon]|nr:type II methionyl aminopeptidase [Candidatus Nanoarchaeia archaeon]
METEKLVRAGKIADECLKLGRREIRIGNKALDVLRKIESLVEKNNAKLAFPTNISINEVAAHEALSFEDNLIFKKNDLVKLDLGVHIDGNIVDCAITIDLGNNNDLVLASKQALKEALKLAVPGTELREIGKKINEVIEGYNLKPVRNLYGHSIEKYNIHGGLKVPNYDNGDKTKLEKGQLIAIEPFATDGFGLIEEGKPSDVYTLKKLKPLRNSKAKEILEFIKEEYKTLPFAKRWILERFPNSNTYFNILVKEEILANYGNLIEKQKGLVSQHETTILVGERILVNESLK